MFSFEVGDLVYKLSGYPFPGEIRAIFTTKAGAQRYVVESTSLPGLLHIFNHEQLEKAETLK
jgi:hypothetical protein